MKDRLDRIISESGKFFGIACDTTTIVNEACRRHDLGPTAAAALGRALSGAILLAGLLKGEQNVQLIFEGNGPLGKVIAQAGCSGWCRGYVQHPRAEVPLKDGLVDVASGIGRAGFLHVIKDIGMKEKYTGLVQLYTSEVAGDIAYYLTESEQTPSTINLGLLLQPDGTISAAGGYLIQSLPPVDESALDDLEDNIKRCQSITALLSSGNSPSEILTQLFAGMRHKATGHTSLGFQCRCSRKKMESVVETLSIDDINYLLQQNDGIDVKCDYCGDNFHFPKKYLQSLAAKRSQH